ncbi:MAG: L,D-transpeptidase [Mesorhizobium sp.]|nr:L,D-transpeptidase [Mesorhizobium sp.]
MHDKQSTSARHGGGRLTRRSFFIAMPAFLAACQSGGMASRATPEPAPAPPRVSPAHLAMYAAMPHEKFPIPAIDVSGIDQKFLRQEVADPTGEASGTLVVDTGERFLFLVQENGRAMRYGIGVGREGLAWEGRADINMKREWPRWTPTENMMARDPALEQYRNGMEPGLTNPLGARALYLFADGRDTLYRLHGTNEPWSIGMAMSSGCIRLFNQDIIDLYGRVPLGSQVLVREHREPQPQV